MTRKKQKEPPIRPLLREIAFSNEEFNGFWKKACLPKLHAENKDYAPDLEENARLILSDIANEYYCAMLDKSFSVDVEKVIAALNRIRDAADKLYSVVSEYDTCSNAPSDLSYKIGVLSDKANENICEDASSDYHFEVARHTTDVAFNNPDVYINIHVAELIEEMNLEFPFGAEHGAIEQFSGGIYAFITCVDAAIAAAQKNRQSDPHDRGRPNQVDMAVVIFLWKLRCLFREHGESKAAAPEKFSAFAIDVHDKIRKQLQTDLRCTQKHLSKGLIRYYLNLHENSQQNCSNESLV